jgi:UrcA family protein
MNRCLLSAAAIAGVVMASATVAQEPRVVISTRVSYADLDLSTPAGARAMLRRIERAAGRVCGQSHSPLFPRTDANMRRAAQPRSGLRSPSSTRRSSSPSSRVLSASHARPPARRLEIKRTPHAEVQVIILMPGIWPRRAFDAGVAEAWNRVWPALAPPCRT